MPATLKKSNKLMPMLSRYTEVFIVNHPDFSSKTKGVVLGSSIHKDRYHYCVYVYKHEGSAYIQQDYLVPTGVIKTAADLEKPTPASASIMKELDLE